MSRATSLALVVVVLAAACSKSPERANIAPTCPCESEGAKPVDPALLAWLSKARTLHHLADLAESEDALDKAIVPLDQLVAGTLPPGPPPEAAEVLADTYARLAELRARRGEFERAERDVSSGLGFAKDKTYFRGHLLEVRGLIYDKLSQNLRDAGKEPEAKLARDKAMKASLEAVNVQDEVIKSALADAGSPKTRE